MRQSYGHFVAKENGPGASLEASGRDMAAQRISLRWILKIAIWCLIVGIVLSALGITPGVFWNSLWRVAQDLYQ